MAKALFLGLPLHGHTNPSLPLVRALVERGDEVVYFSSEPFAAKIQQAGARYRPYRNAFLADLRQLSERTDKISWLLMRTTAEVLAHELDAFRAERPDYIISDSVAPWGQWVAQLLDVPVVTSVTTFAVNRHVLAFAASRGTRPKSARLVLSKIRHVAKAALLGRRLRREHGVKGTGIMGLMFGSFGPEHCLYVASLSALRGEFRRSLPVHRAVNRFTDRDRRLPVGRGVAATDVIYVSLGTLFNADPAFYRSCFEAFGGQNVRVVMSIGTTIDRSEPGLPASELRREAVGSAAGSAAARLGVRVARRHEQRERKPLPRRAAGRRAADGRAGDRRQAGGRAWGGSLPCQERGHGGPASTVGPSRAG